MRNFETGATRDSDEAKHDLEGFLSPLVMQRFAEYMTKHRKQADGKLRDSDNWQKGMPKDAYMKSMFRHFMDVWLNHRGYRAEDLEESLSALMFNVMGYLFETLKAERQMDIAMETIQTSPKFTRDGAYAAFGQYTETVENGDYDPKHDNHGATVQYYDPFSDVARVLDPQLDIQAATHRYGELANDEEAIQREGFDGFIENHEGESQVIFHNENFHCGPYRKGSTAQEIYEHFKACNTPIVTAGYDAPVPGSSSVEHSEVLGVHTERLESEVAEVAPEVRGVAPGETTLPLIGCKW